MLSTKERNVQRTNRPGYESSWERNVQGTKRIGNETSRSPAQWYGYTVPYYWQADYRETVLKYILYKIQNRNFVLTDAEDFRLLFNRFVRPHLKYCVSVWSPYLRKVVDCLEKVQRIAKLPSWLAVLKINQMKSDWKYWALHLWRKEELEAT